MDITWQGSTSFTIKGQSATVAIDPASVDPKTQVVLSSKPPETIPETARLFDWPGEYETKDIPINGFSAFTKPKKEDGTSEGERTVIFRFSVDGITICHLGELGHTLSNEQIERIGNIDVLMIKIGEGSNLDKKKALEIIESIEPRIVIPMGSADMTSALSTMGIQAPVAEPKLTIKSASSLQTDDMKYVLLEGTS
ncbi:MBL fold metallo-hydrolase [Candidatus Gracilibacteria bacterium]|nr:MBL fold metallo-hydrolase [Candidatus Gracilibacteria bacterium]